MELDIVLVMRWISSKQPAILCRSFRSQTIGPVFERKAPGVSAVTAFGDTNSRGRDDVPMHWICAVEIAGTKYEKKYCKEPWEKWGCGEPGTTGDDSAGEDGRTSHSSMGPTKLYSQHTVFRPDQC